MGKRTISMAIFNSYVKLPEGKPIPFPKQFRRQTCVRGRPRPRLAMDRGGGAGHAVAERHPHGLRCERRAISGRLRTQPQEDLKWLCFDMF